MKRAPDEPTYSETASPIGRSTENSADWEQRWHPLRDEWVIIAAHRHRRPWTGDTVNSQPPEAVPPYVADCYLCPGNARVHGERNPAYSDIFVFDNDLPCVSSAAPSLLPPPPGIYRNQPAHGVSRVVCYTPQHNTTLAELSAERIRDVLACWQEQYCELGALPGIKHVLVFENKGKVVGVSNPHPHCQIYATNFVFKTILQEASACARYWQEHHRPLFQDIIASELADRRRLIIESDSAIAFIPYFARYAYETYVAPKETHPSIAGLSSNELTDLAAVLKNVLVKLDNLWRLSFPYVLVLHQAPTGGLAADGFHFHIEIHPPLRTPNLLKYLAGPEIGGGNFLSDTSPEQSAAELRAQPTVHYLDTATLPQK